MNSPASSKEPVREVTLGSSEAPPARDLDDLIAVDAEARAVARDLTAHLVL